MSLLNSWVLNFPDIPANSRAHNTSIVQLDESYFLYAVRVTHLEPFEDFPGIIPGNSVHCKYPADLDYGHNFWWNNWAGHKPGWDLTYFYIGDHRINSFQKLQLQEIPGKLSSQLGVNQLYEIDVRIAKIRDRIYCYSSNLEYIYVLVYHDGILYFRTLIDRLIFRGRNLPLIDYNKGHISTMNWFYHEGVLFENYYKRQIKEYWIPSRENFITGTGSYATGNPENIEEYGANYGITPLFSFSTPHVDYNNLQIGCGHLKIHADPINFPYLPDSNIENFRNNLYLEWKQLFGEKYVRHFGATPPPYCQGFIYMLYFYILIPGEEPFKQMFISNAYLPLLNTEYKFSLIFPLGLILTGDKLIVTAGYGDYYSVALEYNVEDVINKCYHNVQDINMHNYQYLISSVK